MDKKKQTCYSFVFSSVKYTPWKYSSYIFPIFEKKKRSLSTWRNPEVYAPSPDTSVRMYLAELQFNICI